MSNSTRSAVGMLLILLIAFCSVFLVTRLTKGRAQLDLTEDSLYTLTDGTKAILDRVNEPITIKLFYSKAGVNKTGEDSLLQFNNYYLYVRDLLRSYARRSDSITLLEFDPRPFSEAEAEADRLRLRRFGLTKDEGFYFGLSAVGETGNQESIPFLATEEQELVEYRISELIDRVTRREKTRLGLLSSLPVNGDGESEIMRRMMQMQGRQPKQAWYVATQLGQDYDLVSVEATAEEIPEDLDYLVVIHPKNLGDQTLYAIDQFVMRGGKMMVFVDPWCIDDQPEPDPQNPFAAQAERRESSLNRLLTKWGVRMEEQLFAGDLQIAQTLRDPQSGTPTVFPGFVTMTEEADGTVSAQSPVTKGLEPVEMLMAGVLRDTKIEGIDVEPLLQTTSAGNTWSAEAFELAMPGSGAPMIGQLAAKFTAGSDRQMLAARLSGKFQSAFDGPPADEDAISDGSDEIGPSEPDEDAVADHLATCAETNSIIVFADVDMITNFVAFRTQYGMATARNANLSLLLNGLETLAGSTDLLSIRTRGKFRRPFEVIDEIERRAELERRDRIGDVNAEIKEFQTELRKLQNQATTENVGLLENEAIGRVREVEAKIREKERELREVKAASLEEIESLGTWIKALNIGVVPGVVLLLGIAVATFRSQSRRRQVKGGAA